MNRYQHRRAEKEEGKRKREVRIGQTLTRDKTDVVSLANKFKHPKQVDLDRSNVYSSLVLIFKRSLLGYISTFIDLKQQRKR